MQKPSRAPAARRVVVRAAAAVLLLPWAPLAATGLAAPALPAQILAHQNTPQVVAAEFEKGQAAIQKGEFERGVKAFRRVTELDRNNGRAWLLLGYCLHGLGRLDEALPIHEKAAAFPEVAHIGAYNVACVHSLRGDLDEAFAWLHKAMSLGFRDQQQLERDSDLDPLRADPRYRDLLRAIESVVEVYQPLTTRRSARLALFDTKGSPAQINLDYAVLRWRDDFDDRIADQRFVGKWWRLGGDFWTTLDSSVGLQFGEVEVPAGYWYLTLMHQGNRRFVLGFHDPAAVRAMRIDPYRADKLRGGILVPMHYERADELQGELQLQLQLPPGQTERGALRIAFGRHVLTAAVRLELDR